MPVTQIPQKAIRVEPDGKAVKVAGVGPQGIPGTPGVVGITVSPTPPSNPVVGQLWAPGP